MTDAPPDRNRALDEIRDRYHERDERRRNFTEARRRADVGIRRRTASAYDRLLRAGGLLPLGARRILDIGCGEADFLQRCRRTWGQQQAALCGIDLLQERVEALQRAAPYLELRCGGADTIPWPDASFDLIHRSMLFSSIREESLRRMIASEMGRVTRPHGHLLWYDFVWNPTNRATVGMPLKRVMSHFPGWALVGRRRVTVAPPIARALSRLPERLITALEACRFLNLFELVLLRKPGPQNFISANPTPPQGRPV